MADEAPVDGGAFAAAMAPLGPFEPRPLLAVAVSGGPDSMALALLASRWAAERGGAAHALLVDHRLRPESRHELDRAAAALGSRGIAVTRLCVTEPPPSGGLPAWARAARYRLLKDAAAEMGALHLLLGHQMDDQAETVLLNLARGSGVKGIAGMPAVRAGPRMRLLRPMLGFSRARLAATVRAAGAPAADDPTNRDRTYGRVRIREVLADAGADSAGLAATAGRAATEDRALETALAALTADAVRISPLGLIEIDRRRLLAAPPALASRLLARAAHAAGGLTPPPRRDRVDGALAAIRAGNDMRRTLARARIVADREKLRLWREPGRSPPPAVPAAGLAPGTIWDGRFSIVLRGRPPPDAMVGPLGYAGLGQVEAAPDRPVWIGAAPRQALAMLPALSVAGAVAAWPEPAGADTPGLAGGSMANLAIETAFRPPRPLAPETAC